MDALATVLKWMAILGFLGWMALNVLVGYQILVKGGRGEARHSSLRQSPRRTRPAMNRRAPRAGRGAFQSGVANAIL